MEIKGSRLRIQKITFLVVNTRVEKKFHGEKKITRKSVDRKINGHSDRR